MLHLPLTKAFMHPRLEVAVASYSAVFSSAAGLEKKILKICLILTTLSLLHTFLQKFSGLSLFRQSALMMMLP